MDEKENCLWNVGGIFVFCENTNQDMDTYGGGYKGINSVSSP